MLGLFGVALSKRRAEKREKEKGASKKKKTLSTHEQWEQLDRFWLSKKERRKRKETRNNTLSTH